MLVLSRKLNESIVVDGAIRITVLGIRGNHVRIGIAAPDDVTILREELCPYKSEEGDPSRSGDRPECRRPVEKPATPAGLA